MSIERYLEYLSRFILYYHACVVLAPEVEKLKEKQRNITKTEHKMEDKYLLPREILQENLLKLLRYSIPSEDIIGFSCSPSSSLHQEEYHRA